MIETLGGVVLCAVCVFYISTVVCVIAWQRESDRLEFHKLIADLRGDLDALLEHLGLEITAGWPEQEPTEEIPVVQPETVPIARAWDESAAQLVEQAEVQTVEREFHGQTFRFREDAA